MTRPDKVIVFLGGSTTECMFVDEDHRFPYVAGQILEQETGAKINSYNGGMSGSNSLNAIDILINKVIPLKPDVVVFMENINDLSTLLYEGTYWNKRYGPVAPGDPEKAAAGGQTPERNFYSQPQLRL